MTGPDEMFGELCSLLALRPYSFAHNDLELVVGLDFEDCWDGRRRGAGRLCWSRRYEVSRDVLASTGLPSKKSVELW